jgi:predicted 3-demethylubiquinone-9 3-methyltransferase (glyoxalase superfamily)
MKSIVPCLWFAEDAEKAVEFYVSLLPGSRIDNVQRNVMDGPAGAAGDVLVIEFTLAGQPYMALNGRRGIEPNHSVSFAIWCEDQAEIDRLWDGLIGAGGTPDQCGWLRDRWGFSWQIVPSVLKRLIGDPDPAKAGRAMAAMMEMVKLDVAALEAAHRGD